jgi:hypothetical protein
VIWPEPKPLVEMPEPVLHGHLSHTRLTPMVSIVE